MKAIIGLVLCLAILPLQGCAKKSASEQLSEDMNKMSKDMKSSFGN